MKKLFFALMVAAVAIVSSCTKVQPSNLDYSKYTNKATLIIQTQLSGSNYGGIPVDIVVGDIHLQRTSDSMGKIQETVAYKGSLSVTLTSLYQQGEIYFYGEASPSLTTKNGDVYKMVINLTQKSL